MSIKSFEQLINELSLNLNNCINIVSLYDSNEWLNYYPDDEEFNNHKNLFGYYKKLMHINDQFEIYLIFWSPFASSPIHNHPDKGCVLKLLSGKLIEEIYSNKNNYVEYQQTNILNLNSVNNRFGNEILHKIINLENISVSLHVYFPPKFKHNIFKI